MVSCNGRMDMVPWDPRGGTGATGGEEDNNQDSFQEKGTLGLCLKWRKLFQPECTVCESREYISIMLCMVKEVQVDVF